MNGAVELYKACKKHGIKPILGFEAYLSTTARPRPSATSATTSRCWPTTTPGFRNLVKLTLRRLPRGLQPRQGERRHGAARASTPRASSRSRGCLQSRFCQRLVEDNPAEARAHADDLVQIFGPEDVYFEVQKNGIAEQDKANEGIVKIAREMGRPLVGTGDVHYLRREDYHHHAALLCVQTKSTLAEPKMTFDTNEFYLKDSEEMVEAFAPWPEAVPNTLEIAERCNVEIELGQLLIPTLPDARRPGRGRVPARARQEGLRAPLRRPGPAEAVERLEMELGVIGKMGFAAYFLIVWDFVKFAKDNGIAVGPGRGSAAGSIVSYALTSPTSTRSATTCSSSAS